MERKFVENDPQELERFKEQIDLVAYAQRQGYQIKAQGRRGDWQHLVQEGEHLIVSRKDNKQVYFNPGDDRDRGTIIDFVKTRENKSLGEVRQQLRDYLNEVPSPQPPAYERTSSLSQSESAAKGHGPSGPATGDTAETEEAKRTRLISEVLGIHKELTDRSYLYSRGLTDQTIDSPAFQGRIFTSQLTNHKNTAFPLYNENGLASVEQKNTGFKSLLELPKDGIWVSHPTHGKDTAVERLVITESAIDALSYHQLKHDHKNTLYIATAGTVTERQISLIQRVIDKQQPQEVVLADDRDAAGRRYNMNYLNDLHPARPFREVAAQEAYAEAASPVSWHATLGRYHTVLRVAYHHESIAEGADRIQPLVNQVARINAGQAEPGIDLEIQRSTEKDTVFRLSVARADTAQLEVITQELYRQREQLRPEQERQPAAFIRVDYPIAKDFNRDLELKSLGYSPEQIREQALRDEEAKEAQKRARQPEVSPEIRSQEPGGSEKRVIIQVEEPNRGQHEKGQAEAVKETMERSGAGVGVIQNKIEGNGRFSEMQVTYRTDQPEINKISRALDAIGAQKGNSVIEQEPDRAERRERARNTELQRPPQQEIGR